MFGKHKFLFVSLLSLVLFSALAGVTHGVVKDTDTDGLTDPAETDIYLTDPKNADTDSDGFPDGEEILKKTNPLAPDTPTTPIDSPTNTALPLAWYFGRASGVLAFILLTIVVVNGLLITTRLVFRFLPPALNYEMHRFLAWMALIAVIGHLLSFTLDDFFHLTFLEGLIPFSLERDFRSALGASLTWSVGIGTLAFYGILTLIITSELKGKYLGLKKWRALHYMSFLTYLLFLLHGIFAGSDTQTWWMLWLYSLSGGIVTILVIFRIIASIKKRKLDQIKKEAGAQTLSSVDEATLRQ